MRITRSAEPLGVIGSAVRVLPIRRVYRLRSDGRYGDVLLCAPLRCRWRLRDNNFDSVVRNQTREGESSAHSMTVFIIKLGFFEALLFFVGSRESYATSGSGVTEKYF